MNQTHVLLDNPVRRSELGIAHYCLPFIHSSSIVLHVLLSITASHRMLVEGPRRNLIDAYYHHKVQALTIVNGLLASDDTRNTREVQVAIALLAILEVCHILSPPPPPLWHANLILLIVYEWKHGRCEKAYEWIDRVGRDLRYRACAGRSYAHESAQIVSLSCLLWRDASLCT